METISEEEEIEGLWPSESASLILFLGGFDIFLMALRKIYFLNLLYSLNSLDSYSYH